ncbi:MAG: YidC/Oxa1 family membrane protein insertase [Thermomicrobiales bacterium]
MSVPGWSLYVDFLEWVLNGLATTFNSGGLAIVVFTIIIKTILMPLTVKSIRSSKAMQDLQPRIKELQKKHGKDRQELSRQTMELYSTYGVNPLAGCLPMLIQIPIFFGVYRAIVNLSNSDSGPWANGFAWLGDLGDADPWKVLPIAAGVFQFVQTKMMRPQNAPKVTDPQQAIMNQMMNFMPLMVIVFGWGFASGAVVYWVTQSVFSVVQQWFITGWGSVSDWVPGLPELPEHRRLGYRAPRDLDDVVVVSGGVGGKADRGMQGWLQKRLADAQERAEVTRQAQAQAAGTGVVETTATGGTGRADGNGRTTARTGGKATGRRPAATAATGAGEDEEIEAAVPSGTSRSSYQERVDAATRNPARLRRPNLAANGSGDATGEAPAKVTGTNGSNGAGGSNGSSAKVTRVPTQAAARQARPAKKSGRGRA